MPSGLYGFRPKERPQYQSTDAVTNPIDPRIPRVPGQPPVPTAPASESNEPYHSGVSAENDDGGDQDTTGGASYASPQEAFNYGKAAVSQGYFGTVQDAARAGRTDVLSGFLNDPTTTGKVQTPGTLGFLANTAGLTPSHDFTNVDTAQSAVNAGHAANIGIGVDAFGGLGPSVGPTGIGLSGFQHGYSNDPVGSFTSVPSISENAAHDFTGNNVAQVAADRGIAAHSASPNSATADAISGIGYSSTGAAPTGSQYSSTGVFSTGDDNNDSDGSQTGAETSHSGGYGGFSDDAATSDSGGGGGGK